VAYDAKRPEPVRQPQDTRQERPQYRQLSSKERAGAIAAGVVIGAVGFIAMFVTKNEAGVGVAVLLAGVLLVLGIQGTQLGKVGGKDIGFEMMAREERRLEIAERAEQVADENPAEAQGILEGYESADPSARISPALAGARAYVYDQRVIQTLSQFATNLGYGVSVGDVRSYVDALLVFEGGAIAVEAKYTRASVLKPETVVQAHDLARAVAVQGVLVVTNAAVSPRVGEALKELAPPVEVVTWNGDDDNANLVNAIQRLRAREQGSGPSGNRVTD
jgi:hypothetical protein